MSLPKRMHSLQPSEMHSFSNTTMLSRDVKHRFFLFQQSCLFLQALSFPCYDERMDYIQPNSVIRDRTDFVRMSSRLSAAFAKGVAGYAEEERQRRCRQSSYKSNIHK